MPKQIDKYIEERKEIYLYLVELIKNAKYVISLDADLSDWNIEFLQKVKQRDYIVYHNINKNKKGIDTIMYKYSGKLLEKMKDNLIINKYFIACFDSLKKMNKIIDYLSKFGNKEEWKIYSSEVNYSLIDTKEWINKFVFFTPSIIYGIDFNYECVDVFALIYKNHLNSLQIYQMVSRARKQNIVHIYCNDKCNYLKYKNKESVIEETKLYEKNLGVLVPITNNYIDIDDKPYRCMYYNNKYIDSLLKTNTKGYLIDILENKGYNIIENDEYKFDMIETIKNEELTVNIKERIINLLELDENNLSDLEKKIVSNDNALEKHMNLRIFLKNNINNELIESLVNNLFIETLKSKYSKLKICCELMKVLEINRLEELTKDITKNFSNKIENKWLTENIKIIIKTFDIRTTKYNDFTYYNIYLLLITILKNLFDNDLFIKHEIKIKQHKYKLNTIDKKLLEEHNNIMNRMNLNRLL